MISGDKPFFCDGNSPMAAAWYERKTKAELGNIVAELACRLLEIDDTISTSSEYGEHKHYGRWARWMKTLECEMQAEFDAKVVNRSD